jgi:hypothetical protein
VACRPRELLPGPYYHIVFTLPAAIADIAYHNKAVIYGILFKAAAETRLPPTQSTSGRGSASPRCCTAGARR